MSGKDPRRYAIDTPLSFHFQIANEYREELIAPFAPAHPNREVAERMSSTFPRPNPEQLSVPQLHK